MLPSRWDPFRDLSKELSQLHREMDDMFRRTFGLTREPGEGLGIGTPAINTYMKDHIFHVDVEVPGVKREKLDVSVDGNMLTISGERTADRETKDHDYLVRETHFGAFRRRLMLPEGADAEKIQAVCKNGILEISMPVGTKETAGRKIPIEGGEEEGKLKTKD
ncbi:Hsp20/alpha crystallin family protein [Trichloromonas sp.]|uniref:Hsp20/alpha crystallin family protein n=1 Tax=Trichloromonas sp. TaxID=3069249 RepID=UPI002A3E71D7|nr:Hsp20/alpha crystallin family protein [Trichloromonas sp.]